ncbi:hypothetical protein [Variovorax sp. PAMC 28711]|uniref:hypothetical protein n=1 Tax=Variovorax sp. PAMC 28711 TaxID=1795631 RepID=UPI00078D4DEA|nr:hypothetical protein [Variovorax sp. PAMC 28711]AMM23179.1 hypothetical protein AX767_01410 [Variovorax sp. PAMC 28711]
MLRIPYKIHEGKTMKNDSAAILDDLLSRWHSWARSYSPVPVCGADPMFRNAKSGKGWDSTSDVIEDDLQGKMMEAVDFQVSEMRDPHRSALYVLARNLSTGRSVWLSPRLPRDPLERGVIVQEARNHLIRRLMSAGVM